MNIYIAIGLIAYLSIGIGFAIAAWLQAAEMEVDKTGKYTFKLKTFAFFTVAWWLVAIYCFQTEVSRTKKPIDFSEFDK